MTPEETKWRASVYAPEKLRRKLKLQYWLLGAWSLLAGAWVVLLCTGTDTFGWTTAVALLAGYANILLGIVNLRRLLAGKKLFSHEGTSPKNDRKNAKNGNLKKRSYVIHLYTHHCRRDPFV